MAVALPLPLVDSVVARNVLVAFDGSPGSKCALACAIELVRESKGRLTLLTVVPRMPPPAPGMVGPYDPTSIECGMVDALRAATDTIPEDIPVTTIVAHGSASAEICRRVECGCYDLVVLGWEGHGPMKGALAGVGTKVKRHCTVPVLKVQAPRC
jgi:nucleotide-binding universal stress UspA family protein